MSLTNVKRPIQVRTIPEKNTPISFKIPVVPMWIKDLDFKSMECKMTLNTGNSAWSFMDLEINLLRARSRKNIMNPAVSGV
jgi:hypothetical protein